MKVFKRRLAAVLAAVLAISAQPIMAESLPVKTGQKEGYLTASSSNAVMDTGAEKSAMATSSNAAVKVPSEEVVFNTGNHEFSIVSYDDFMNKELGDAFFGEDGSYTINIPEENPFFPYEVQFTHKGKVTTEWFMTPDDSVEVGGHTFYVSAYFDGSVVTQMSLEIAGDTVVVYPERKTFNKGDGAMEMSLLPLKERYLNVDVSDYTPAELTMVSLKSIFAGEQEVKDTDQVVWSPNRNDNYSVNSSGDTVDLSYRTSYGSQQTWEMIVGENDQLAGSNIRYFVTLNVQNSTNWLIPTVSRVDEEGNRVNVPVIKAQYKDTDNINYENDVIFRKLDFYVPSYEVAHGEEVYVGFKINPEVIDNPRYAQIKVFQGWINWDMEPSMDEKEITDMIYDVDVMKENSGYQFTKEYIYGQYISIVSFDAEGKRTGNLPVCLKMYRQDDYFDASLNDKPENGGASVSHITRSGYENGCPYHSFELKQDFPVNGIYYLKMSYRDTYENWDNSKVTAAYVGQYESISKANDAGAKNIKEELFSDEDTGGYAADYSEGVYFTIFVGEDGAAGQRRYYYCIKTVEGTIIPDAPSSNTSLSFSGLVDSDENLVESVIVGKNKDSYGEQNYLTILVDEDVDLTKLAPQFSIDKKSKLYASGDSSPEISGKSFHDFSNGPIQYTVIAEDESDANYWLQIVKAVSGENKLYINSLADENAETRVEDDVIYSTREILLDGLHGDKHDILLINMSKEEIAALSAELESDQVELDGYWTLKGKHKLSGFDLTDGEQFDKQKNMAKLRIKALDYVEKGTDVSGTLTIKSGDTVLMVLALTGTVGDPCIVTKEIPEAVKYVPYGTVIQNSNKYSWNHVSYNLQRGKLPAGMELRPNGEIYGVPTETGEFTFTVTMKSSNNSLSSDSRTFTIVVNENTDANVEATTDQGYHLIQRIQNISLNSSADQTMVSEGTYAEFTDLFLDGVKLQEGVDYNSESGSTRITIRSQTLKKSNATGTHTLGIEFRTKDTKDLKRAAQNYVVTGSGGNNDSDDDDRDNNSSRNNVSNKSTLVRDPKKGLMDPEKGIITGEGEGYSRWHQDEHGWKLIYADGTAAAGYMTEGPDGATVEQVIWERVNGFWYAFGTDEYLKSGWIYDYMLRQWYYMAVENGMKFGWIDETQDGCTYYLEPANGQLVTGWRLIDEKWYYFSEDIAAPTWLYDEATGAWQYDLSSERKPFGAMYRDEETPDGYVVGIDGVWNGIEK